MVLLLICVISIVVIVFTVFTTKKLLLKRKGARLTAKIAEITPYHQSLKSGTSAVFQKENSFFTSIKSDFEQSFIGRYISFEEKDKFIRRYSNLYNEIQEVLNKIEDSDTETFEKIKTFAQDFKGINDLVESHNNQIIQNELDIHKVFFDSCLKYPLDPQQRRSIVSHENNCLVISSAGSGKTSSIVGKVKYLLNVKHINTERILLISYTNKAAAELTERIGIAGLRGYTFHKLAIDTIAKITGQKPSICDNTDILFLDIYHKMLNDTSFKQSIIEYFIDYKLEVSEWEQQKDKRRQNLSERKNVRQKALFPDMDGNPIYVRSEQELKICFALSSLGVKFRYEEPYEVPLADEMHSQYKPDFSIYYDENGAIKRIYLEHFGIDEHGLVPLWFAEEKGVSYEEANRTYNDGITWKKAAHSKFGTTLLTTSSADFHYVDIRKKLKSLLENSGVPIIEKTNEELFEMVLPSKSKQEKAFIRLIATFINLMKSSCKSSHEILHQTKENRDDRSFFIIKNIFLPIYDRYNEELNNKNQIDFTDAILKATEIFRSTNHIEYEYIIVDEFQDISVDRYKFLQALRSDKTKLYCVGDDWQSIYRFSGSDMALFNQFSEYFGLTEINKIETTYRFGQPLVDLSSRFIQKNSSQIKKDIHPFNPLSKTDLQFLSYERYNYCDVVGKLIESIPDDKTIFLIGRYSFDDYYLSFRYKSIKEGSHFFYLIGNRKIEFLTVHKSKGLEADYVIILQCNKDTYGFPSLVNDDPVLNYVLTKGDQFSFGEERRLFYVAITRAKIKTFVLYDNRIPSVFVDEFLNPVKINEDSYKKHPNANKPWSRAADNFLLTLYHEGKSIKYISDKMGRSQTSIIMRIGKLEENHEAKTQSRNSPNHRIGFK